MMKMYRAVHEPIKSRENTGLAHRDLKVRVSVGENTSDDRMDMSKKAAAVGIVLL